MKKRLLSAALALAMVLTMLPLTAFAYTYDSPAPEGDGTETVAYLEYGNANNQYLSSGGTGTDFKGAGWYVTLDVPAVIGSDGKPDPTQPRKTVYYKVTDGISLSGKYYNNSNYDSTATEDPTTKKVTNKSIYNQSKDSTTSAFVKTGLKPGALVVIGGTSWKIDVIDGTSLSLDVYKDGKATIKQTNTPGKTTKLTSVTVNNSQHLKYGKGSINIDDVMDTLTRLDLKNVTLDATTLMLDSKVATTNKGTGHTVSLTNVTTTAAITLDGVGTDKDKTRAAQSLNITNSTVGALAVDSTDGTPATVTFNVPNDPSNTLGGTSNAITNYTKKTVKGGTWTQPVPAANLDASLAYQLKKGAADSTYTYYTSDQLGEAILEQGTDTANNVLTKIGDSGTNKKTVSFMNGSMLWGEMSISADVVIPKLPTQMNNTKTPYWSDGKFSNLAGSYSVPSTGATLNAGGGVVSTDVTKLNDVKITTGSGASTISIKAALAGSAIVLSGAVESGDTKFDLELETDAVEYDDQNNKEVPVTIKLSVIFDPSTKSLTIANPGTQTLGHGVIIENTFQAIKLSNGSRYTFDGKGLVVKTEQIKVKDVDKGYPVDDTAISKNGIEVIVSAPGYTATQALKDQVINLINGTDASAVWKDSPAVQRAVNAALATITDKTVEGYINAATARARSDNRLASGKDTAYQSTGTQTWLVPYLEVNVTNYLPNDYNPSLTATLTLKWRVEVIPGSVTPTAPAAKEAANVANKEGTFIAKQGTALVLDGDLGEKGVKITFAGISGHTFAHQADTYDYKIETKAFTVTHAVNGNLGKFVLDTVKPLIELGTKKTGASAMDTVEQYFSTLQAAVDAAEDGKMIEINSNYKGSTTINMTGKARTVYIQANGKNVVVANASGGMVEENEKGSFYTIKLNRDNTVTANAVVSVGSASNGSASVDTTIAKPGSSVSGKYTASSGYKAGSFTATAQPGNKSVSVSVSANGTFSFTVPSDATSVTVTPSFVLDNGLPFTDVANNAWYFTAVKYCYDTTNNGYRLMEGDSAATFAPNGSFTRAHMVQILWNMKGRPTPKTTANPFRDMSSSSWYYSAVLWAYENGYAKGYPDGTFKPGQAVTRQEMVQFLYQASGSRSGSGNLSYYSDGYTANNWAQPALRWATGLGILSGQNSASLGNTLAPRAVAKRCEVAVTVMNFDKLNLF